MIAVHRSQRVSRVAFCGELLKHIASHSLLLTSNFNGLTFGPGALTPQGRQGQGQGKGKGAAATPEDGSLLAALF